MKKLLELLANWYENEETPYLKILLITALIACVIYAVANGIETFCL